MSSTSLLNTIGLTNFHGSGNNNNIFSTSSSSPIFTELTSTNIHLSTLTHVYHIIMAICGYELPNLSILLNSPSISPHTINNTVSSLNTPLTTTVSTPISTSLGTTSISNDVLQVNMCIPCNAILLMHKCWNILCPSSTMTDTDTSNESSVFPKLQSLSSLSLHSLAIACLHLSCKFHEKLIKLPLITNIYKQYALQYYIVLPEYSTLSYDKIINTILNISDLGILSEIEFYILNIWLHLPTNYQSPNIDTIHSIPSTTSTNLSSSIYVQYYIQNYHTWLLSLPISRSITIHYPYEIIERQLLNLSLRFIQRFNLTSSTSSITSHTDLSENIGYQYSNLLVTVTYPLICMAYVYLPELISTLTIPIYNIHTKNKNTSTTIIINNNHHEAGEVLFAIAVIYASVYRICNEPIEYVTDNNPTLVPDLMSIDSDNNTITTGSSFLPSNIQNENRIIWEEVYKWLLEFPFVWNILSSLSSTAQTKLSLKENNKINQKSNFEILIEELKILVQYIQ